MALPLLHVIVCPEHQHMYSKKTSATSSNHRQVAAPKKDNTPPLVRLVHSLLDFPFFDREVAPAAPPRPGHLLHRRAPVEMQLAGEGTARGAEWTSLTNGILVTFWPVAPPRDSCFTVRCPDLKPDEYGQHTQKVATPKDNTPPLVRLVHSLPGFPFFDREVALLRRHDQDTFFLAVLP
ncbi:hypothetical protein ZWY2020_008718 [Hordeum vulgare]|nr:hypothetical protein ZWY2020_008718 [Hordeum vulgare]